MKIIHALWSLGTGGTESMLADIVNEQVKEHDVYIIIVNDMLSLTILNRINTKCKIIRCYRKRGSKSPVPLLKFNYYLWKIHADVIHIHMDNLGKYLWFTHGAKKVRTIHCAFGTSNDYKHYDRLFSISEGVRQFTLEQGFESTVIYNGIHPEQIKFREKSNQIENITQIVNVGRLQQIKGQQLLVEAAHKLILLGHKNFRVDLIGDGENREALEKLIVDYHLERYIRLLGMKSRDFIYKNLCNYDIYVQPSLSEGFGLTLAEAMAAGVPVITSDQKGPMEVIGNGKFGSFFKTNNVMALVTVLLKMINTKEKRNVIAARDFVVNNFDITKTAQKYIQEYYNVM